jgi:hypothetical protein
MQVEEDDRTMVLECCKIKVTAFFTVQVQRGYEIHVEISRRH